MKLTKNKKTALIGFLALGVAAFFFHPEARSENRVRTPVNVLSPQELNQLSSLYQEKRDSNLYESQPQYEQQVHAAQGRNSMTAIQQVRDGAAQASQQQIQSAFLRNVAEIKKLIESGQVKGDPYQAIALANTELQVALGSQISRLEASGDTSPATQTAISRLQAAQNSATLFAGIAETVKRYGDLSDKNEAAQRGGTAAQVDFNAAVMTEFLGQVKNYADFRKDEAIKALEAMPALGPQIGGLGGAGVQEHIETMFGHEGARDRWQTISYNTAEAVDKIDKLNTAVQTIDRMVNSPDYQAIQRNEYVSGDAKDMAQVMLAAGEAVQGVASILGSEMGNVPAAILSQAGDGIKSIGLAVGFAGNLEGTKLQGGRDGISGEFLGQLPDFQASGMRVLENGATGELTIPDGSGNKSGDVTLSAAEAQTLRDAVSSFTSLTGRNPTQQELNSLAGGGRVDVGGGDRMGMNQLANPHNRTDFDVRGGERAQLDAFLNQALAGVPPDKLTIFDPDTGKRRPMTDDEKREHFGEKLEEMNALSQALHGQDVSPNVFGADIINDGKWTDKMRQDLEDKKRQDAGAPVPQDPGAAGAPPKPDESAAGPVRDHMGLTAEERIGIAAAEQRRVQEAERKAEEERKKAEEQRRAEEEQRKKDEETRKDQDADFGAAGVTSLGPQSETPCGWLFSFLGTPEGGYDSGDESAFDRMDSLNRTGGTRTGPDTRDMSVSTGTQAPAPPSGHSHSHPEYSW